MATALSLDRFLKDEPLVRARSVERGLPARFVKDLLADPAIRLVDLAGIVARRRTLDRRLAENDRLTSDESDRLASFLGILALAEQVFGSRGDAMEWLRDAKDRFDGARPLDLMRTHTGAQVVETLLQQARHGMLA